MSTVDEEKYSEYQDMIPMYVSKIDEVYDFVKDQKTAQEMPINKYVNYAVIATMLTVGLLYSKVTDMQTRVRIGESKLDFVLQSFDNYKKSIKALNGMVCMQCHNTPDMMLQNLGSQFNSIEEFTAYVRAGGRQKNGIVMPPITEQVADDYTLGKIWKTLK